ncbi:MAG: hypothetical protein PVH87_01670 [Desulfobacteraceae bacterium]|jgi:hypothetical protein
MKKRFLMALVAVCAATLLMSAFAVAGQAHYLHSHAFKRVEAGEVWVVTETTRLHGLFLDEGATITAPEGYSLSLTVNGVETGGELVTTAGVETEIAPGTYLGHIVLTVAEENLVEYAPAGPPGTPSVIFPFRQAFYLDDNGLVEEKSVLSAVMGRKWAGGPLKNMLIRSDGENFNGIYATGGDRTIRNTKIDFFGNGRSDFAGYGAAVMATGETTRLVLDHAIIVTEGVVRTAAVADHGSNLVVKNSYLQTYDGVLPDDYIPTIDTAQMRSVPWMLSLSGNCRATNLLGTDTKASYINSYIGAEGWGVLSTDGCTTPRLTAINSTIAITGEDGYGSYGIGDATERFLGCTFNVATYATISRGSFLYYGDSDPAVVAQLNTDLDLGLTAKELRRIKRRPTIVNSRRFGIMWHGGGTLDISGGTVFNTGETTFLDKGQAIAITVDGSRGARLNPGNGVILQVMDDDDPGPVFPDMTNTGVYEEPTGDVEPQAGHDLTVADDSDALATFANITLNGDFYNGMRGDIPGPFGPPSPRNLGLTFVNADINGVITASETHHHISTITAEAYDELGEVTNTPGPAVNNGVIVALTAASTWTVSDTCYLTGLTIDADSVVQAPAGQGVTMTVDGIETDIAPGTYTGAIVLVVE